MASSRNLADRSIPPKDPKRDGYDDHEQKVSSISEITSQDEDNYSVISGQYDQDTSTEDVPRRELHYETTVERAPQTGGIKFDRLNSTSSLTRTVPQVQGFRGEVQRPGIDPIPPVQTPKKPANSALSLRIDLNLDIEVDLKASIRGDLTLTLL
ncbi:hypothetical protein N7451_005133 [Penicillium sp. IBT 35674x]|nr:hypothetical protein N7451_005133 [Penicillium sp. IBT 35674x]